MSFEYDRIMIKIFFYIKRVVYVNRIILVFVVYIFDRIIVVFCVFYFYIWMSFYVQEKNIDLLD